MNPYQVIEESSGIIFKNQKERCLTKNKYFKLNLYYTNLLFQEIIKKNATYVNYLYYQLPANILSYITEKGLINFRIGYFPININGFCCRELSHNDETFNVGIIIKWTYKKSILIDTFYHELGHAIDYFASPTICLNTNNRFCISDLELNKLLRYDLIHLKSSFLDLYKDEHSKICELFAEIVSDILRQTNRYSKCSSYSYIQNYLFNL